MRLPRAALAVRKLSLSSLSVRDLLIVGLPMIALVVGAFWLAYQFVQPAPPSSFIIATGSESGAYHAFAEKYREHLRKHGIEIEIRTSAGAVQNIEQLRDENSNVDVVFTQGGILRPDNTDGLLSLGAAFYEPVWIFYRSKKPLDRVRELAGKRIAIGSMGSGTRHLALEILQANAADGAPSQLLDMSAEKAAVELLTDKIDAMFVVGASETGVVRALLYSPDVRLLSFSRAAAYTRLFPHLSAVTLPQGSIDLVRDIPAQDTKLIATTAQVVVRENFHPALADLLLDAMRRAHGGMGPLQQTGDFPNPRTGDVPISDNAQRFYKSGPPFLQRYMPFWAATLVDRVIVLLVPLFAVLVPAMRFAPSIYTWRVRSKIARWYGELKLLEYEIRHRYDASKRAAYQRSLEDLEDKAFQRSIPLGFTGQVYILREHIALVQDILDRRAAGRLPPESEAESGPRRESNHGGAD